MYNGFMSGEGKLNGERGQVILLVILIMTVVGVIALSVASRSVTGLRVQELSNESVKAFKAAESGLEKALLGGAGVSGTDGKISYEVEYESIGADGLVTDEQVSEGESAQIMTTGSGQVNIYWMSAAAVRIAEYWGDEGVTYYNLDPDGGRRAVNNFDEASCGGSYTVPGVSSLVFDCLQTATLDAQTKFVRVLSLYSPTYVGVKSVAGLLPDQKIIVSSKGVYEVDEQKDVTRQIDYSETEKRLPVIFDNVLYTNANLSQ